MSANASFVPFGRRMPLPGFATACGLIVTAAREVVSPVELASLCERLDKDLSPAELDECETLLKKIHALAREKAIKRQADVQRARIESARRTLDLMAEESSLARAVALLEA